MKNSIIKFGALAVSAVLMTGCLEETYPTSSATQDQLSASSSAANATLAGIPSQIKSYGIVSSSYHMDFGLPSMMHIRDVMTGDMPIAESNYDQYYYYAAVGYLSPEYVLCQIPWNTYYKMIQVANLSIAAFPEDCEEMFKSSRGASLAFRAAMYLEASQFYEFKANNGTSSVNSDGNDVLGLTIPILTEKTTEKEAQNNPRVDHKTMFEFILGDLQEAESLLKTYGNCSNEYLPNLAVTYGLEARLYLWDEQYDKAAQYADLAINCGYTPVTQSQWLDTSTGFNTPNQAWMWYATYESEDGAVKTGIINWPSFMAPEATYGYAGAGVFPMISSALYNKINDSDFRKLSFKAPEDSKLYSKVPYITTDGNIYDQFPTYTGLKFRPGSGEIGESTVGNLVSVPFMRVEEMYLIKAEATAHSNPAEGKRLLEEFVKTYRDSKYVCNAESQDDIIDECLTQKSIELWGEGLIFFDIKRLNKSVTRSYDGSNFGSGTRYNTDGRPAWMNFQITRQEIQNNRGLDGYNNPSFLSVYTSADI
jgi:hypothetical protein